MGYHLNGSCIQAECFYLHQEIVFLPRALAAYRQYLANIPCVLGEFCKYHRQGLCFHNHDYAGDLGSVPVDQLEVDGLAFSPDPQASTFVPGTPSFQVYRARESSGKRGRDSRTRMTLKLADVAKRVNELASAWAAEPTFRNPDVPCSDPTR